MRYWRSEGRAERPGAGFRRLPLSLFPLACLIFEAGIAGGE